MANPLKREISAETNRKILTFVLLAGLWMFAHPYRGVQHDSVLYSFQALSHLYPWLRGDLFFAYGSQDDFSLFSRIYAWVISGIGLQNASVLVLVLCQSLWLWMAWKISALLPTVRRVVFLALLFSIPGYYNATSFLYGEMFVTARIVAETMTLSALAAMFSGRVRLAWGLMLCAGVIHPLMASGGILFLLIFQGQKSPRRSLIALALLGLLAVFLISVLGLWGRFSVMDPSWFSLVRERCRHIFILSWSLSDQNLLILNLCALFAAWHFAENSVLKRLFGALLIIGIIAVVLNLVGDKLWHCQLLIQVQPVRMLWLVKWFSFLGFASLLRHKSVGGWIPLLLVLGWFAQGSLGGLLALCAAGLSFSSWRFWPIPRWIWALLLPAFVAWVLMRYQENVHNLLRNANLCDGYGHGARCLPARDAVFLMLTLDMAVPFGCCAAWWLDRVWSAPGGPRPCRAFPAFVALTLVYGLVIFSSSRAETRPYFTDRSQPSALDRFAAHIPRNAVVYWPDNIGKTWYYLGRVSYYSYFQSSGALFSRASTMEMKRRADRVGAVGSQDAIWDAYGPLLYPLPRGRMRQGLFYLCRDPKLDYVVLEQHFPALSHVSWADTSEHKIWWLYDCGKIRHNLK